MLGAPKPEIENSYELRDRTREQIAEYGKKIINHALAAEKEIHALGQLAPEGIIEMPAGFKIKVAPKDRTFLYKKVINYKQYTGNRVYGKPWTAETGWQRSEEPLTQQEPFLADYLKIDTQPTGWGVIFTFRAATDEGYKELKIEANSTLDLFTFDFVPEEVPASQSQAVGQTTI